MLACAETSSRIGPLAEVYLVLVVAALRVTDGPGVLDELDGPNPLDDLEAELVLNPQSQWRPIILPGRR
jgi:hypothetical protein